MTNPRYTVAYPTAGMVSVCFHSGALNLQDLEDIIYREFAGTPRHLLQIVPTDNKSIVYVQRTY